MTLLWSKSCSYAPFSLEKVYNSTFPWGSKTPSYFHWRVRSLVPHRGREGAPHMLVGRKDGSFWGRREMSFRKNCQSFSDIFRFRFRSGRPFSHCGGCQGGQNISLKVLPTCHYASPPILKLAQWNDMKQCFFIVCVLGFFLQMLFGMREENSNLTCILDSD